MNEVMLVLKPTAYGGKSNHSTYENDILGEVIGVPDAKVDSFDLMPEAVRKKYSETLGAAQKAQVVAPYGVGVREIESPSKRKQLVIGENADLKQNVKDFLLQANDMEAQGESREEIRLATGWERGADNKWGYELSDFIDVDLDNIQANKLYNIEDIVTYPEIFEAYNDLKKLKIKFIDNPRKSGIAAYYAKKGLIEVNLSKINLSEYVEEKMIKSKLAQNPEVLAAATREANALIKQAELEKRGVKRNSLEWNTEMQSVYPDAQNLIDRKTINDYLSENNVSYSDFFKDVRIIERSILNKSEIDLEKGKDELNSKVLHELQHAVADLAGFPRGGSPSNIQLTFTEQEKKEYNEIVKEVARISKLVTEGKIDYDKYVEVKTKEVEYRYRKYNELAGEAMSINVERRKELSPEQRREMTLESTMNVNIDDQKILKILYEEEKNIAIKEKKVEGKKKPEKRRGIFGIFKKRKQLVEHIENPKVVISGASDGFQVISKKNVDTKQAESIKDGRADKRFDKDGFREVKLEDGSTELTYKVEGFTDRGNRPSFVQASIILPEGVQIDRQKIKTAFDNATKKIKLSRGGIKLTNLDPRQERDLLNSVIDSLKPSDIDEIIQQLRDFDFTNDEINKFLKDEGYTDLDNYLESPASVSRRMISHQERGLIEL
jgi:hypothetical protein